MVLKIALIILGSLSFLFAFWKRLKDDYFENQILGSGFIILFFILISNIGLLFFNYSYWFWGSMVGLLIGTIIASKRFGLRFFEVLEACVLALFAPVIAILIFDGISQKRASSFFAISVIAVLIGFYYFLNTRYKTFTWYKSGRVGFAGLSILGLFFLTRAIVAYLFPNMVSFSGYDWLISAVTAFLSFLTLANLTVKKS